MEKIEEFEDLIAWQKARELTRLVYQMTRTAAIAKDFGLIDQIRRSAVSIMSNIAEGFDRGGKKEFHQFLVIAKGFCGELRSQIYIALDANYINQKQFDNLSNKALEVSKIIAGLRIAVAKKLNPE